MKTCCERIELVRPCVYITVRYDRDFLFEIDILIPKKTIIIILYSTLISTIKYVNDVINRNIFILNFPVMQLTIYFESRL